MEFIKPGTQFDFMRWRWQFLGFSVVVLLLSVGSFFYPGPKLGTDFRGGTEIEVAFLKDVSANEIREAVEKNGFESPDVVSVGRAEQRQFLVRVQEVSALSEAQRAKVQAQLCLVHEEGTAPNDAACTEDLQTNEVKFSPGGDKISARFENAPPAGDEARKAWLAKIAERMGAVEGIQIRKGANSVVLLSERDHKVELHLTSKGDQLLQALQKDLGSDRVPESALRVEWIGPKAGEQLRDAAITSVLIAIVCIMGYIALRFDLRFAPGGILALAHDVGIALGAMVLTQREITLSTVAAMLTIVGYSITDTVVVYDRIRENLGKHRNLSFGQIINLSVSEMFGRTIITAGATALSMICFLIWGTTVIKDFAFALLIGILVGTYSSIYIAAPFTEWVDRRFFGGSATSRKKVSRTRAAKRADAVV